MTFRGLPEPYDYYGTCNAGECVTTSPRHLTLDDTPNVIAETSVAPRQSTCNATLPSGLYLVSAELALPNVRLCANRAATITVPSPVDAAMRFTRDLMRPATGCSDPLSPVL